MTDNKILVDNIEVGNLYQTSRDESKYGRLVHLSQAYVLKMNWSDARTNRTVHRFGGRNDFEKQVKAGRLKEVNPEDVPEDVTVPLMPADDSAVEIDWTEIEGVGSKTDSKLREAGVGTDQDLAERDNSELIEIYGMSEAKLDRMLAYAE